MVEPLVADIPNFQELPHVLASQEVSKILAQRGFCFINGFADPRVRRDAEKEARELRRTNALRRTPREACSALLGEQSSCWTRRLAAPQEKPPPPAETNLLSIDACLGKVGTALAACHQSVGELVSRLPGLLHYSRMPEDRPPPRLVDPAEADEYLQHATARKVVLLYYLGPSPATLTMTPRADPKCVYQVSAKGNTVLVYRTDICILSLDTKGIGVTVEVDFLMRGCRSLQKAACDALPMPRALDEWYLDRMEAIVQNGMYGQEDIPIGFRRDAVTTFFKVTPVRVVQLWHDLPSLPNFGGSVVPFEASLLGGLDPVTEICKPRSQKDPFDAAGQTSAAFLSSARSWGGKWDPDEYYDADPGAAGDFKMYTRHLAVLNRGHDPADDYDVRDFGMTTLENLTMDHRARMLMEAHLKCLKLANFDKEDTRNTNVGFFTGLSGENHVYNFMTREQKLNKFSMHNISNASIVNRLSYALGCNGPCLCLDTGESGGAAALDAAVSGMREERCGPMCFASGCEFISSPFQIILQCAAGVLSKTGRTRVFDDSADGSTKGEGVVAALLELHDSPSRKEKRKSGPLQPGEKDFDTVGIRALILGSGTNSKGRSSSLSAPSGPALQDVVWRAARAAHVPPAILDAVEVNAFGSRLADAIEWATLADVVQHRERAETVMLRSSKATYGNLGPVNGLVSLVRSCKLMELGAHGPMVHLRQLLDTSGLGARPERLELLTEALEARFLSQVVGVSSFGSTGTNCHQILWGVRPDERLEPARTRAISWWPGGLQQPVAPPLRGYFIVGTWSAWQVPWIMEEESEGVYGYTLTLGENRWESFQIWLDEDSERVLHPDEACASREATVEGPDGDVPRDLSWCVSGLSETARLLNEEQMRQLDESGEVPEQPCLMAYEGGYLPPGSENATASGMPAVELNRTGVGGPGEKYRVRLHVRGKYKRVEWSKAVGRQQESAPDEPRYVHAYKVVGDFSYWTFQDMEVDPSEEGLHVATVQLLKESASFQIYRDGDWEQGFYPQVPDGDAESPIAGPDMAGQGKNWRIHGRVGDFFRLEFRRRTAGGAQTVDERSLGWAFERSGEVDFAERAKSHRYYYAGSSTGFRKLVEMKRDETTGHYAVEVVAGSSNTEHFQLLLNKNMLCAVHPDIAEATMFEDGHMVQGPDENGDGMYWVIGTTARDHLTQGSKVHLKVHMEMADGRPSRVWWEKFESPDAHREYIAWGSQSAFDRRCRLMGFAPSDASGPGKLLERPPFMDLERVIGQLPCAE